MTNEEAIEMLDTAIEVARDEMAVALLMVYKVVEKQIPKKPKYKTKINTVQGFQCKDIYVLCPSCDNRLYSIIDGEAVAGKKTNCCEKCGQALDWSEE